MKFHRIAKNYILDNDLSFFKFESKITQIYDIHLFWCASFCHNIRVTENTITTTCCSSELTNSIFEMNVANFAVMSGYFVSYNFSSIRKFKFAYEHTIYDFFRWIHLNLTADAQKIIWKLVSFICQIEKENKFYVKWHELRKHAHNRLDYLLTKSNL